MKTTIAKYFTRIKQKSLVVVKDQEDYRDQMRRQFDHRVSDAVAFACTKLGLNHFTTRSLEERGILLAIMFKLDKPISK